MTLRQVIIAFVFIALGVESRPDEQRLLDKLFNPDRYDNSVRPVYNSSESVKVEFGFTLIQIMDMVSTALVYPAPVDVFHFSNLISA